MRNRNLLFPSLQIPDLENVGMLVVSSSLIQYISLVPGDTAEPTSMPMMSFCSLIEHTTSQHGAGKSFFIDFWPHSSSPYTFTTSWWLSHPFEKYTRQIGLFLQGSG